MVVSTARHSMAALSMASMSWEDDQEGSSGGKCREHSATLWQRVIASAAFRGLKMRWPWWVERTRLAVRGAPHGNPGQPSDGPRR